MSSLDTCNVEQQMSDVELDGWVLLRVTGRKEAGIHLNVDKHAGEP